MVMAGPDRGRARALDREEISIGKREDADLPLTDPTVSRHHCVVVAAPFGALIRDLGSRNGVRIDGHWIESAYLRTGALVRLGETVLVLDSNQPVAADAEARDQHLGAALGSSPAMQRIFGLVPRLANSDASLLIEGETGTGKTLLVRGDSQAEPRQDGPFIVIDCGAIPAALIESELFGHERGAFTGATSARAGAFEAAAGGTVLLDEIGELPLEMQPKLLRAIEQRVIRRVGSNEDRADERPHHRRHEPRSRSKRCGKGPLPSDLYYRLVAVRIAIPPLRERREDIPALANHFAQRFGGADAAPLPRAMIDTFMRQSWPGNIRELRNAVERAILLGESSAAEMAFSSAARRPAPCRRRDRRRAVVPRAQGARRRRLGGRVPRAPSASGRRQHLARGAHRADGSQLPARDPAQARPGTRAMSRPPARMMAFVGLMAVPVLAACVDAHWQEGIRCAEESCPAALVCCAGRCLKSCNATDGATGAERGTTATGAEPAALAGTDTRARAAEPGRAERNQHRERRSWQGWRLWPRGRGRLFGGRVPAGGGYGPWGAPWAGGWGGRGRLGWTRIWRRRWVALRRSLAAARHHQTIAAVTPARPAATNPPMLAACQV